MDIVCASTAPSRHLPDRPVSETTMTEQAFRKYECIVCGYIYDEAEGCPDDGIAPGTRWEDVPEDWLCPDCGVGKEDFEPI
jgi:rubredoxin